MKGRTYRYFEAEALYPFGYGLTYSKVELSNLYVEEVNNNFETVKVIIDIKNVGNYDTDEVVQCYLKDLESKFAVINHSLVGFKRVALRKGEIKTVSFELRRREFEAVNDEGERILDSKKFKLFVGVSQPDRRSVELCGLAPLEKEINIK